jgi:hypothetical protein
VTGEEFVSNSTINWNGSNRTTSESGANLTATITAADIVTAGAAQITVVNPGAGGGTSNPLAFVINGTAAAASPGFVYVANSLGENPDVAGNILAFSVDPNIGRLTPLSGSPFQAGAGPTSVTVDPFNKFLYVANGMSNFASAYDLSTSAGRCGRDLGLLHFPARTGPES